MHEGASVPQEGPIDPLAKFNRVMKVISGLSADSKKMNQLQAFDLNYESSTNNMC